MWSSSVPSPTSSQRRGRRRSSLQPRTAEAYAPAAITNFFEISYDSHQHATGATGGGYILSKGTRTRASFASDGTPQVRTVVNGDPSYDARTTRRAVLLLLEEARRRGTVFLEQVVDTPIGSGFGASASASTSAVYAVSSAAKVRRPKKDLALFAYRSEILEQTGLGTVSVIFKGVGAGAITVPGEPGKARFITVKVPKGTKVVTASLSPFDKRDALSSRQVSERINMLGHESLETFLSDPSLENLAAEGERFSRRLGLESPEVRKLIRVSKSAGASYASQNMIGYATHSLVSAEESEKVARALNHFSGSVRVDVFEVGTRAAGLMPSRRRQAPW